MLFSLWIPAEMEDAGQRTVTQVPTDVVNAPSPGVHVTCMALVSWEHMSGAVNVDGLDSLR